MPQVTPELGQAALLALEALPPVTTQDQPELQSLQRGSSITFLGAWEHKASGEVNVHLSPDPESTALCSDRLIYAKQALFLSTKLGRWYQAVPAQKLELRTF